MQITNVTSPKYSTSDNSAVDCLISLDDSAPSIPFTASANDSEQHGRDLYAELTAGIHGPVAAYTAPAPAIPAEVTMRQARLALRQSGLLASVDTAIAGLPEPDATDAAIEWEYSQSVVRTQPFTQTLAGALGLTEADLDNLFTLAASL